MGLLPINGMQVILANASHLYLCHIDYEKPVAFMRLNEWKCFEGNLNPLLNIAQISYHPFLGWLLVMVQAEWEGHKRWCLYEI